VPDARRLRGRGASLAVASASYRDDSRLVDVTLTNVSDATFALANAGAHNFYGHAAVIRVPAHGEVTVGVAGEPRTAFDLELDVLSAVTAPGEHLRVKLGVEVR